MGEYSVVCDSCDRVFLYAKDSTIINATCPFCGGHPKSTPNNS